MQRYIAFVWNHRVDDRQAHIEALTMRLQSTLPEFRCLLSAGGLRVYHAGGGTRSRQAHVLPDNRGVVIGTVFRSGTGTACASPEKVFNDRDSRKIGETAGRYLVEEYWGRYVALLTGEGGASVRVLRDPTGAMPCQLLSLPGIDVVCSHTADCHTLNLIDCCIHWDHIVRFLWFHRLVTRETGLAGVRNIRAGECVRLWDGRTDSAFYWRPEEVHDVRTLDDPAEAMHKLGTCIQTCTAAWSSCYGSILHRLSGGLDSAIVLACLSGRGNSNKLIAQNLYTHDAEGDERAFAHAAARRAGIEMFETRLDPADRPFEKILDAAPVASPALTQLAMENIRTRDRLVREYEIEAVFSGQGGDHLFQRSATRLIAAEFASRHGLRPGLLPVVLDTARFTNESVWSVLAAVAAYGVFRRRRDPYSGRFKLPPFLGAATRDALDVREVRHPWVEYGRHLPAAKILQITDIIDSQNFHNTSYPGVEAVHPLISQPIIETCLQIPSYVLTCGGVDRALVRQAFRDRLPPEIGSRTSKGGTTSYVYRYLVQNLPLIREYLLDGTLVGHGILDKAKMEECLTESRLVRDAALLFPVLNSLRAEAWLCSWTHARHRAVA